MRRPNIKNLILLSIFLNTTNIKGIMIRLRNKIINNKQTNSEQTAGKDKWVTFTTSGNYIISITKKFGK
jgi:hypothetical protein